jgi:hypothetical protein
LTKEKKKLFNDGLFTQENRKKNKETLYTEKIRSVANSIHVVILHTDKGPKTWWDFPRA